MKFMPILSDVAFAMAAVSVVLTLYRQKALNSTWPRLTQQIVLSGIGAMFSLAPRVFSLGASVGVASAIVALVIVATAFVLRYRSRSTSADNGAA